MSAFTMLHCLLDHTVPVLSQDDVPCMCCQHKPLGPSLPEDVKNTVWQKRKQMHANRWKFREKTGSTVDSGISLYLLVKYCELLHCMELLSVLIIHYMLCCFSVCFTVDFCHFRAMLIALNTCPEESPLFNLFAVWFTSQQLRLSCMLPSLR